MAVERRDFLNSPLPLTPEFIRNIRLLGRRPTAQLITDNLIKKYGTHFLLSATLGGRNIYIFCDTSSRCFSTKVTIPAVSELETAVFFFFCFFKRQIDLMHIYISISTLIKPRKITCDIIMYYFFHCVFGRGGRCKQIASCPEWVTFLKFTHYFGQFSNSQTPLLTSCFT